MGELDTFVKAFFRKPEIFAALFNRCLFQGKKVISPADLKEERTMEVFQGTKKASFFLKRERDLLKTLALKRGKDCSYLLLGLEVQSYHDASMVLRCLTYDVINYNCQLLNARKMHRKRRKSAKGSYLGSQCDLPRKLTPVVTLVLVLNDDPWTGPRELHDMLEMPDAPAFKDFIANYHLNIVAPGVMTEQEILSYGNELGAVLLAARNAGDKKALLETMQTHEIFRQLDFDAARLINKITRLNFNFSEEEKKEKIDMTQKNITFKEYFLQEGRKEGRKEGREEGRKEGLEEGQRHGAIFALMRQGKPRTEIRDWLMEAFSLTKQQASREITKYQATLQQ